MAMRTMNLAALFKLANRYRTAYDDDENCSMCCNSIQTIKSDGKKLRKCILMGINNNKHNHASRSKVCRQFNIKPEDNDSDE